MLIQIGYLISSVLALIVWKTGIFECIKCQNTVYLIGLFNRSWLLWGAVYYSVAFMLLIWNERRNLTIIYLTSGMVFHWGLIIYSYFKANYFCYVCLGFLVFTTGLNFLYFLNNHNYKFNNIFKFLSVSLVVISLSLLVINPVNQPLENNTIIYQENDKTFGPVFKAFNKNGKIKEIDLRKKPALLFSEWCPHCSDALEIIAENYKKNPPYLVAVFTDFDNKKEIEQKLKDAGLEGFDYYISLAKPPINKVPRMVWWEDKLVVVKIGEIKKSNINTTKKVSKNAGKINEIKNCSFCDEIEKRLNNLKTN